MPTTVTDNLGNTHHLWQLPDRSAPEPEDGIRFTTLDNEMCQGNRSSLLIGSNTGVREWTLKLPQLSGASVRAASLTDPYAGTVSFEQYVRNVAKYNRTTGNPIVYQWPPDTGQYYLVDVDGDVTMQRQRGVDIYASEISFKQRRLPGVTVFSVAAANAINNGNAVFAWALPTNFATPTWTAEIGGTGTASGDVVKVAAAQNGQDILRFSNSASTGKMIGPGGRTLYELFIPMKMREAAFSSNCGVVTSNNASGPQPLLGASGTTKFQNPGLSAAAFTYRLNGVVHAQSDMQAPMNAWGIVHIRYTTGYAYNPVTVLLQFGQDRTTAATFAKMDIGEPIAVGKPITADTSREITEYLAVKWGITI